MSSPDIDQIESKESPVKIVIAGDVFLGGNIHQHYVAMNDKIHEELFQDVLSCFMDADVSFLNLEGAVNDGVSYCTDSRIYLSNPGYTFDVLKNAGIKVLSLANNHALDHGVQGMLHTLVMSKGKVNVSGIGDDLGYAVTPAVIKLRGSSVAFLSFSETWGHPEWAASANRPGLAEAKPEVVLPAVQRAVQKYDFVFVYLHHGLNRSFIPTPQVRTLSHKVIQAGAMGVLCSHIHQVAAMEILDGRPIFYGLGDLCFPETVGKGFHIRPFSRCKDSLLIEFNLRPDRDVSWTTKVMHFDSKRQKVSKASFIRRMIVKARLKVLSLPLHASLDNYGTVFHAMDMRSPESLIGRMCRTLFELFPMCEHMWWTLAKPTTCRPFLSIGYRPSKLFDRIIEKTEIIHKTSISMISILRNWWL